MTDEGSRAIDVAQAVKAFLWEYGSGSSPESKDFYDRNVSILTAVEASEVLGYSSTALLVVAMEGLFDWPSEAWSALHAKFPAFQLENINGWALGIYSVIPGPFEIPNLHK